MVHYLYSKLTKAESDYKRGDIRLAELKLAEVLKAVDEYPGGRNAYPNAPRDGMDTFRWLAWNLLATIRDHQNRFSESLELRLAFLNDTNYEYSGEFDWTDPIGTSEGIRHWKLEEFVTESASYGHEPARLFYEWETSFNYRLGVIAGLQKKCGNDQAAVLWEQASLRRLQQEPRKEESSDETWERWISS